MTAEAKHPAIVQGLALAANSPIHADEQTRARDAWAQCQWPTRKTEAWKYTPVKALADGNFLSRPSADPELDNINMLYAIDQLNSVDLVFVDGQFQAQLSTDLSALPSGLNITALADAPSAVLAQYFNRAAGEHATLFGDLNTAALEQGFVVEVAKNADITQPVHIVNIATQTDACAVNARVLWLQHTGSRASLVEHFASSASATVFTNSITELFVGENAQCQHYRLHLEGEQNQHIGGVYSQLQKNARLNSFYVAMGANLQRVDVVTQFEGEGAEAVNNGVYLPRNKQITDFHTCIEHKVPHCTSNEIFRGIIGDSARAVFNGRIHIHKDAQKTLAELSNKNLLTSEKAEVNTKPELEIYADDVRCAHGATIAKIDPLAMYYLCSRGISKEEAQVLLSFGFINELIEQLENAAIAAFLRPIIATRFAKNPELTQHILTPTEAS
ncbi:MAG TPA: Fe-S cluster assembly protein SufD [Marinagarivorans sp.]